ncbi:MAG: hypothetical protein Salg2KO_16790 [Salibacteraceae bacterium]
MLRRLRIYFTGFGIGIIAVYLIFSKSEDRNLDIWAPGQRILEDIRNDSIFQSSDRLSCFKQCLALSDAELSEFWVEAKTKSLNPGGEPYQYLISHSTESRMLEAEIEWDKTSHRKLIYIRDKRNPTECKCDE